MMKLIAIILSIGMLQVGLAAKGQQVTLSETDATLDQVFLKISEQTGFGFLVEGRMLKGTKPVTINVRDLALAEVLRLVFEDQPLTYTVEDQAVIVSRKRAASRISDKPTSGTGNLILAYPTVAGRIVDSVSNPLVGASVRVLDAEGKRTALQTKTDHDGYFTLRDVPDDAMLELTYIGYAKQVVKAGAEMGNVMLIALESELEEVEVMVSTGYQTLPKERATGSFSTISGETLNQQVGTDILSRLPAITNSIMMDAGRSQSKPQMMVRGLSTINGPKDPLIVVDNFPYDGDINNINPNIVENITILRDAAAASIWGARAANGVIVITTKKGQFNKPVLIDFNSNLTIGSKPDLYYIPQMSAADFIDVEQELYNRGFYRSKINSTSKPLISPVIDLLDLADQGTVNKDDALAQINRWRTIDARDQFEQQVYNPAYNQQYFMSASGGTSNFKWNSAAGFDRNIESLGATYQRLNLKFQNTYRVTKRLSLNTNLYYTQAKTQSGKEGYADVSNLLPYMRIADDNGDALAIPKGNRQSFLQSFGGGQLLDWSYYPLNDWRHKTSNGTTADVLGSVELQYEIIDGLRAGVNYQYERQQSLSSSLYDEQSYDTRDYVNRFTQLNNGEVKYIVPKGAMLGKGYAVLVANNIRGVLSYDKQFERGELSAIAGGELRDAQNNGFNDRFYGYNPNNMTFGNVDYTQTYANVITGAKSYIQNMQSISDKTTRFVSQFANAAYSYDNRYTLSVSARRDASNLFGLKTNDQWNPFWSAGVAWKLSDEHFYQSEAIPYLNIRATYGFSGNVDPAMVAVSTIGFGAQPSVFTGLPTANYTNFYNPLLKWETSKMFNLAADFRSKNNRISGAIEYYHKKGENLFGEAPVDLTTGVNSWMQRNVATMHGNGLDLELRSINIDNAAFKWSSTLNFSLYKDAIDYYLLERTLAQAYVNVATPPISGISGHPVYAVYAYKWGGLDPNTGEAQGYLDGNLSKDYAALIGAQTSFSDLEFFGSAIPTKYGNFLNTLSYQGVTMQIGMNYKFGYWFRRSSINYTNLFNNWRGGHIDYANRWRKPGDEAFTDVPVNPYTTNNNRDRFYEGASILVEKGDHIRLQYINIGYQFAQVKHFKALQLHLNIQNIGILWKANDSGIDPDFNLGAGRTVAPTTYSFGIKAKF